MASLGSDRLCSPPGTLRGTREDGAQVTPWETVLDLTLPAPLNVHPLIRPQRHHYFPMPYNTPETTSLTPWSLVELGMWPIPRCGSSAFLCGSAYWASSEWAFLPVKHSLLDSQHNVYGCHVSTGIFQNPTSSTTRGLSMQPMTSPNHVLSCCTCLFTHSIFKLGLRTYTLFPSRMSASYLVDGTPPPQARDRVGERHSFVTAYNLLFTVLTLSLLLPKAVLVYKREAAAPTTLDLVYAVGIAIVFFWVGEWHKAAPEKYQWFFEAHFPTVLVNLLNNAISGYRGQREITLLPETPNHSTGVTGQYQLSNAGIMHTGSTQDRPPCVRGVIVQRTDVLEVAGSNDEEEVSRLLDLAAKFSSQFDQSGRISDIESSIALFRRALIMQPASHGNRPTSLNSLANALGTVFALLGRSEDLCEAISLYRDALTLLPPLHPNRSTTLIDLASVLHTRFDQYLQQEDLDEAISLHREALKLHTLPHFQRATSLNNLANVLESRFGQSGQPEDLDEAISLYRDALMLLPTCDPNLPTSLNNLGTALDTRFGQFGLHEDLQEAIALHREALKLLPAYHPGRPTTLNNLANALDTQFNIYVCHEDLEEAISLHQEVLELIPAHHQDRPISLVNFANALNTRFHASGHTVDLENAIAIYREALEKLHPSHFNRPSALHNLAKALMARYDILDQIEDLEEAIDISHKSLAALPHGHPSRCHISTDLGVAFIRAYHDYRRTTQSQDLDDAVATFRAAVGCESAPVSERFRASMMWAKHAASVHQSGLEAFRVAIELLPKLTMLRPDVESRIQILALGSNGLARDAAACAITLGRYQQAIEFLEEGRGIFWSQMLQLRAKLDDLHDVAPDFGRRLRRISLALEKGSLRDVSKNLTNSSKVVMSQERHAVHFRHLNDEWLSTLQEVRKLDGFQDFLLPRSFHTLQLAAAESPVAVLNASETRSDALVITSTGVHHIPLPDLTFGKVNGLVELVREAVSNYARVSPLPLRSGCHSGSFTQPDDDIRSVLATLWALLVKPVLISLKLQKSEEPKILRWCPTGPFTFLPVHAAGLYDTEEAESVADYVVSSYTPTISALNPVPPPTKPFKMMAVIQPDTLGESLLSSTNVELRKIKAHVPGEHLVTLGVPGAAATVKEVLSHLQTASFVHFACHGAQRLNNPLESGLILEDGSLTISEIMRNPLPNASLAFLSACQTATGDEKLPDEAIHLAAAMLFAGFQGAVATMWHVADIDGPQIADTFYGHLFKPNSLSTTDPHPPCPDITQAARALHLSISKLRADGASLMRWVPYIYVGI